MTTFETMPFHLRTERLILRPWAESDATVGDNGGVVWLTRSLP